MAAWRREVLTARFRFGLVVEAQRGLYKMQGNLIEWSKESSGRTATESTGASAKPRGNGRSGLWRMFNQWIALLARWQRGLG